MEYQPSMIPQFIFRLEQATSEQDIQEACLEIKSAVVERWVNESTRRKPMSDIRKAVRDRFPMKPTDEEKASFPCYFTNSGRGRVNRWEHLAIKYLSEEWNPKSEVVKPNVTIPKTVKPEVVKPEVVKPEVDILGEVGLADEELKLVRSAIDGADVRGWVRQAIWQRAKALTAQQERLNEDLSEVSSEVLMNEKKYRSSSTAARELVARAVRVVKQWNLDHLDQKWCITNKLLGELTGVTVKAIAKAVEGMEIESYNQGQGLEPLRNRFTKASVGNPSDVMSLVKVTGIEGTEKQIQVASQRVEERIKNLNRNATMMDIFECLSHNPGYKAQSKVDGKTATYEAVWGEGGRLKAAKCLEDGTISEVR